VLAREPGGAGHAVHGAGGRLAVVACEREAAGSSGLQGATSSDVLSPRPRGSVGSRVLVAESAADSVARSCLLEVTQTHIPCLVWGPVRCVYSERAVTVP